jgi:hypothetical protein
VSELLASPETTRAIAGARAIVALVGGYDGAGNFGDVALVATARALVERLGPDVLALPVVERAHLEAHRARDDRPVLVFGEPGDGLLPVAAPAAPCGLYLYGGGYLNADFGPRRLAMARALEDTLGVDARIASGLQADAEWTGAQHDMLARFAPLGARDAQSAQALPGAVLTGDDAVAVLPEPSGASPEERVNVHISDHAWIMDGYEAVEQRWIAALAAAGGRPVVQPVIAYDDATTSDQPASERFARRCAELGHEVAEPLLLGPDTLTEAGAVLERAAFSLSGSFHVALTSLLLGVPTALAADNAYYEQKAAGLREDFAVPADATEVARRATDTAVRAGLLAQAAAVRARRTRVEADLLARLGGGLLTAAAGRLAERAEEAGRLRGQLAQLRIELQATQRETTNPSLPADARLAVEEAAARATASGAARASEQVRRRAAEERIAELEGTIESLENQLTVVYGSRSWKLTAPLRATRSGRRGSTL